MPTQTTEHNISVAQEILRQLGGMNRMIAMTGARNFVAIDNGVSFRIPATAPGTANYFKIVLNSKDLYDVEAGRVHGKSYKVIATGEGYYDDMLRPFVERYSGMYLSFQYGGTISPRRMKAQALAANRKELQRINGMNHSELAAEYEQKFGMPAAHHDYNILGAALYYNKRIKHLNPEEITTFRDSYAKGGSIDGLDKAKKEARAKFSWVLQDGRSIYITRSKSGDFNFFFDQPGTQQIGQSAAHIPAQDRGSVNMVVYEIKPSGPYTKMLDNHNLQVVHWVDNVRYTLELPIRELEHYIAITGWTNANKLRDLNNAEVNAELDKLGNKEYVYMPADVKEWWKRYTVDRKKFEQGGVLASRATPFIKANIEATKNNDWERARQNKREAMDLLRAQYPDYGPYLQDQRADKDYKHIYTSLTGQMKYGGKIQEEAIEHIARRSGMRTSAVHDFISHNNLNAQDIAKDIGTGKLSVMDFITAVAGEHGNRYRKQVIETYQSETMSAGGIIERNTPYLPLVIADRVSADVMDKHFGTRIDAVTAQYMDTLSEYLYKHAEVLYKQSEDFRKQIGKGSQKGLDKFYKLMTQWAEAYMQQHPLVEEQQFEEVLIKKDGGNISDIDEQLEHALADRMYYGLAEATYSPLTKNKYALDNITLAQMVKDGLLVSEDYVPDVRHSEFYWFNEKGHEAIQSPQDIIDKYFSSEMVTYEDGGTTSGPEKKKEPSKHIGFKKLAKEVAKEYEGQPVKAKYQKEYGKTYSKSEAMEVGDKVAAKVARLKGMKKGGKIKKNSTFEDKVTAIADGLKGTPVPPKYRADYGKVYGSKSSKEAARRIAGAMRAKTGS